MEIKVNANRMNLLKLRKRLKFAVRGHKLLKDKQEQLTKEFNKIIAELKILRNEIETELIEIYKLLKITYSYFSTYHINKWCENIAKILDYKYETSVQYKFNLKYNILKFSYNKDFDELITTEPYFNLAVKKLQKILYKIIHLANLEHLCELIAKELQTTRRRVNALEYIMIPQLNYKIKFIINKLNEFERMNITQLMRIKQLQYKE